MKPTDARMTELTTQIQRLNLAVRNLAEVSSRLRDLAKTKPAHRQTLTAIGELTAEAANNVAWVNVRLSMDAAALLESD